MIRLRHHDRVALPQILGQVRNIPTYIFIAQIGVHVLVDMGRADLVGSEILVLHEEVASKGYAVGCFEVEAVIVEVVVGRNSNL